MIDYNFVQLMFTKYSKHLQDVIESILTLVDSYDRQLNELRKLDQKKYGNRVKELEEKKTEAFKKLAHISPNIDKMANHIQEIQQKFIKDNAQRCWDTHYQLALKR